MTPVSHEMFYSPSVNRPFAIGDDCGKDRLRQAVRYRHGLENVLAA